MNRSTIPFFPLALLFAGLLGLSIWIAGSRGHDPAVHDPGGNSLDSKSATQSSPSSGNLLDTAFENLGGRSISDEARRSLGVLRTSLAEMPKDRAVALIRGFLDSGKDHATGLSFEISNGGQLSEWPTFRVFLLDMLVAIDPATAAAVGREILENPTTADEWAIALRNVALGEPLEVNAGYLREKTEELINNPEWQAEPSIGYLNAFDVLVEVEATASTPLLSELLQRKDRRDLAHAGFLTLDRLVQRQPADLLGRLAADRALQQSRPEMVAQQFARADLRDPDQREITKAWLLDAARTPVELRSFAGVYPNNNRFVSNNLLTRDSGQSGLELAEQDREALQIISAWADDPAFQPVRETIDAMVSRLEGFVGDRATSSLSESAVPPPATE